MTAIELLEALSEATVRASFQKTFSILLALSELPLITLEIAIAQLEAQNNTIRFYMHYWFLALKK